MDQYNQLIQDYGAIIIQDHPLIKFTVQNSDGSEFICCYKNGNLMVYYNKVASQLDLINKMGSVVVYNKSTNIDNIGNVISFLQGYLQQYNQL